MIYVNYYHCNNYAKMFVLRNNISVPIIGTVATFILLLLKIGYIIFFVYTVISICYMLNNYTQEFCEQSWLGTYVFLSFIRHLPLELKINDNSNNTRSTIVSYKCSTTLPFYQILIAGMFFGFGLNEYYVKCANTMDHLLFYKIGIVMVVINGLDCIANIVLTIMNFPNIFYKKITHVVNQDQYNQRVNNLNEPLNNIV